MHARLALGEVALPYHSQELPYDQLIFEGRRAMRGAYKLCGQKQRCQHSFFSPGAHSPTGNCETDVQRNAEKEPSDLARWEVNEKNAFPPFPIL